jgi:AhpD family alkylhydroperoxidase
MQTIQPVNTKNVSGATQRLFDEVNERGVLSNMIKTLAQSPAALEGYLQLRNALSGGTLSPVICEQIALTVAQINLCEYSLAEHTHLANKLGLKQEQVWASRQALATDKKTDAILRFSRDLANRKSDHAVLELRELGCTDAEILEIVAQVALNVFENYVNEVAQTDLDFPKLGRFVTAA